jgi:hypothetical protein
MSAQAMLGLAAACWERRMVIIAGLALAGIIAHLLLRFGIRSEDFAYHFPLGMVLALGGVPLIRADHQPRRDRKAPC